ncbi:MAG TPA: hypothetical protein DHV69_03265 [Sphaerochaeta sp.]|nr:MAG: hypothetical protein A2Y31_13410 [Spirochaetes bacterium GWC2_52_13]PKL19900.1 MAG: hypothetical protein CVV48_15715 [Spirochaetae bacterium HGW-Spirochaetae-4]HCG64691.1 hypothetical protein [Sphaerochaeta sp.]HCJ94247.1 hypothetical protein [Sphaerochaeta sp.]HCS37505.1 hypothetical protein [Sphaerochaeta sp.]
MKKLFAIALGLSETASAHVRRLQNSFWKKTGDISHISLLPLVPIVWSSHQFAPFEQLSIPPMPQEVSFGHLMTVGGYLFLGASDDGWLHTTEEIRRLCVPAHEEHPLEIPFPCAPGIYLGKNFDHDGQITPVTNSDWRLLHLTIEWEEHENNLRSLRYGITSDRHVVNCR